MSYTVLSAFIEDSHHYKKGEGYPFEGEAEQERADFLADKDKNGKVAFIEKVSADPFKGVKATKLREALESNEIEVPEKADRAALIELLIANEITLEK